MTTTARNRRKPLWLIVVVMVGAALLVTAIMLAVLGLSSSDTARSMAKGVVIGAPVGLVVVLTAVLRQRRRYRHSDVDERTSLLGDERDRRITTEAFAITGLASLLYTSAFAVAIAIGAGAEEAVAVLILALIGTLVVSSVVLSARS